MIRNRGNESVRLRYVGISHKSARLSDREPFAMSNKRKKVLADEIKSAFLDVHGLLILSTCNRTEIYFESKETTASDLLNHWLEWMGLSRAVALKGAFVLMNDTRNTAHHLLQVINGLHSAVKGDKQILSQVKEAYQLSLNQNMQGSILERMLQAGFRSHKRISNETEYRNGSTSLAYLALKSIEENFGSDLSNRKLLIIGAGQIAADVVNYMPKFSFDSVSISNRSEVNARELSDSNGLQFFEWEKVIQGELADFDAVITAVSNRPNLLKPDSFGRFEQVVVDLAFPTNVDPCVGEMKSCTLINIDQLSAEIESTDIKQTQSLDNVNQIVDEELAEFLEWVDGEEIRAFIREFKEATFQNVQTILGVKMNRPNHKEKLKEEITLLTNQLTKERAKSLFSPKRGKGVFEPSLYTELR